MLTLQNLRWSGKQLLSAILQILQHNLRSGWTRAFGPRNSARYFGLVFCMQNPYKIRKFCTGWQPCHYHDVIMGAIASQITSLTIVYSTVCSCADQRKHQSSASLNFVRGIHRRPVNSPHKWPVTRKMFPFDDVIMVPVYVIPLLVIRSSYIQNEIRIIGFDMYKTV